MARLEDLQPNAAVRGIFRDALVTVVSVQWFGSEALELTYKSPAGKVATELLYRHDESRSAGRRPGAGKTIMAGLYIRELIARGDLQRCLVVCPGSLADRGGATTSDRVARTRLVAASTCRDLGRAGVDFVRRAEAQAMLKGHGFPQPFAG